MDGSLNPPVFTFQSAARSHRGGRVSNEDRILDRSNDGFWAVADGVGGEKGGALAASALVTALGEVQRASAGYTRLKDVIREVEAVNAALFKAEGEAGGSTLVALLAHEGHYACMWAGDSRAYLFRNRQLSSITRDHSLVQALVDDGLISEADRREHPSSHIITRAIGAMAEVSIDQRFAVIEDGDQFLLCSDGLTGSLSDEDIATVMSENPLDAIADQLMRLALDRQAQDNVSFVLVRCRGSEHPDVAS
jgi:serine/threonine protein phosphatase PrpC